MTSNHRAAFNRISVRKWALIAVSSVVLALTIVSSIPLAQAFTWAGQVQLSPPNQALWRPDMRVSPLDKLAYFTGESRVNPPYRILLYDSSNPSNPLLTDVQNGSTSGVYNDARSRLAFGADGTFYFTWREASAGYKGFFRRMLPNRTFPDSGVSIGALYKNSGGGGDMDMPDIAVSQLTNKVYITGMVYNVAGGSGSFGFGEFNVATNNFNEIRNGASGVGQVRPRICVDSHQGRDDLHMVGWLSGDLYAWDRINGVWSFSTPLTRSGASGYTFGRGSLNIACGTDGYAYAAFDSINANNTAPTSTGLARFTPGTGWALVNRNPGQPFGDHDIYGLQYTDPNIFGAVNGSAVTITPDGRVWLATGVSGGAYSGVVAAAFSARGQNLDSLDRAITNNPTNDGVNIEFSTGTSRMHVMGTFKESPSPRSSFYSYTDLIPPPTNLTATAVSSSRIDLAWNYSPSSPVTNVRVERYNAATISWDVIAAALPVNQTTFTDSNLAQPGMGYAYRIQGYVGNSFSAYTDPAYATTLSPVYLAYDQKPGQVEPGRAFNPSFKISVRDQNNNLVTNYNRNITLAVTAGPTGVGLGGTTSVVANGGIADFSASNLSVAKIGNYQITASGAGVPSGTLTAITGVTASGKLVFTQNPAGDPFLGSNFSVAVQAQRISDNSVIANYDGLVTVYIKPGTGAGGANLYLNNTLPVTVNANAGTATFNSLTLDRFGDNYILAASSFDPLTIGYSASFNTNAKVIFNSTNPIIPAAPQVSQSFQVVALIIDNNGSLLSNYNGPVTLALSSGPAGGVLNGNLIANASGGVVIFQNLSVDKPSNGTNYVLQVSIPRYTNPTTISFSAADPPNCNNLIVNTTGDGATDSATNNATDCSAITLRAALGRAAASNTEKIVRLDIPRTITIGSALPFADGVGIDAGCAGGNPGLTLQSGGGKLLFQVGKNSPLRGIKLINPNNPALGIRFVVPNSKDGNTLSCFRVAQS